MADGTLPSCSGSPTLTLSFVFSERSGSLEKQCVTGLSFSLLSSHMWPWSHTTHHRQSVQFSKYSFAAGPSSVLMLEIFKFQQFSYMTIEVEAFYFFTWRKIFMLKQFQNNSVDEKGGPQVILLVHSFDHHSLNFVQGPYATCLWDRARPGPWAQEAHIQNN